VVLMAGQPEELVQQQGEDRVLSPVYSDEGFLPNDVVLMAGQPEEPVKQQGEDRVLSPVYSDEGFLPHDVVLMAGQPEEPVQQQGEDGGLSQDVAGSYQAWIQESSLSVSNPDPL
jgi:hypothetical protein